MGFLIGFWLVEMFQCNIELLEPLKQADEEPRFWVVGKYNFDPGIHEGEEIWISWEVWGKNYNLKTKVVGRKRVVYPPSSLWHKSGYLF